MSATSKSTSTNLWDRYHELLQDYIDHGDENRLRALIELSAEKGIALETTSGRVAASVRAVLSAYTSIGAHSMEVDVNRRSRPETEAVEVPAPKTPDSAADRLVTLSTPEINGDTIVIEIRGRCPDHRLPVVRLDYVSPRTGGQGTIPPLVKPIEPRQLYDVLVRLLARDSRG